MRCRRGVSAALGMPTLYHRPDSVRTMLSQLCHCDSIPRAPTGTYEIGPETRNPHCDQDCRIRAPSGADEGLQAHHLRLPWKWRTVSSTTAGGCGSSSTACRWRTSTTTAESTAWTWATGRSPATTMRRAPRVRDRRCRAVCRADSSQSANPPRFVGVTSGWRVQRARHPSCSARCRLSARGAPFSARASRPWCGLTRETGEQGGSVVHLMTSVR